MMDGGLKQAVKLAVHASVHSYFNQKRHHYSQSNFKLNRPAVLAEWCGICAA